MKGLTTGVRASLRHLLPLPQQRRVICEIHVSRSTNHRAFRTSFRKIPFRISQITHSLIKPLTESKGSVIILVESLHRRSLISLQCFGFYNWWTRFHWSDLILLWFYFWSNSAHPWQYKRSTTTGIFMLGRCIQWDTAGLHIGPTFVYNIYKWSGRLLWK